MTITLQWDEKKPTTLCATFRAQWKWEEFYRAFDRASAMIAGRDQSIDILVDLTHSAPLPPGVFWHLSHLAERLVDNTGVIVISTTHQVHLALYISGCGLFPKILKTMRVAESVQTARMIIEMERSLSKEE
jgi:hypothetical protein